MTMAKKSKRMITAKQMKHFALNVEADISNFDPLKTTILLDALKSAKENGIYQTQEELSFELDKLRREVGILSDRNRVLLADSKKFGNELRKLGYTIRE
jgi:hypothetical protein